MLSQTAPVWRSAADPLDLLAAGRKHRFGRENEFLVEFFSFTQASEADGNLIFRLPRQLDQGTRELENRDWFPHVEHEDRSEVKRRCLVQL